MARYTLKNPLKKGYSQRSVALNIAEMRRAKVPQSQAVKIALTEARKAWREKHLRGKYPSHLALSSANIKVQTKVRKKKRVRNPRGVIQQSTKPTYIIETAGKHAGVIKRNPRTGRAVTKAMKLYNDFTGENPRFIDEWQVEIPAAAMQIGKITGIMYTTRMDGRQQEFLHEFTGRSRPILAASADGNQLFVLGGEYHFSERGIVDGTATLKR